MPQQLFHNEKTDSEGRFNIFIIALVQIQFIPSNDKIKSRQRFFLTVTEQESKKFMISSFFLGDPIIEWKLSIQKQKLLMNSHGHNSSILLSNINTLGIITKKTFVYTSLHFGVIGGLTQSNIISQLFLEHVFQLMSHI